MDIPQEQIPIAILTQLHAKNFVRHTGKTSRIISLLLDLNISMLKQILSRFSSLPSTGAIPKSDVPHALGTLLVRAAKADKIYLFEEVELIDDLLAHRYRLTRDQAEDLRQECETLDVAMPDTQSFAHVLRDAIDYNERVATILALWEVVFADGQAVDAEVELLKELEELLGVSPEKSRELYKLAESAT